MGKLRDLKCKNQWWDRYGSRVNNLLTLIDEKRFQNSYEGDVKYEEIIFLTQGLVFALETAQLEVEVLKNSLLELTNKINELKEKIKENEEDVITD